MNNRDDVLTRVHEWQIHAHQTSASVAASWGYCRE
jgi:hypothetical protein